MKRHLKYFSILLLAFTTASLSCSKTTQDKTGVEVNDVAKEVPDAPQEVATNREESSKPAHLPITEKVSALDKSAKMQYHAFDTEIKRLEMEISNASAIKKVKLVKTRAALIKKRNALLGE
tara:strand:+ start:692 stop:1054 length:363 start_codon:yes stop_codon:yes gene_type:complete